MYMELSNKSFFTFYIHAMVVIFRKKDNVVIYASRVLDQLFKFFWPRNDKWHLCVQILANHLNLVPFL